MPEQTVHREPLDLAAATYASTGAGRGWPVVSYLTAPVVGGAAAWDRAVELPETAELWRRRAVLWRRQRDQARATLHAVGRNRGGGRG